MLLSIHFFENLWNYYKCFSQMYQFSNYLYIDVNQTIIITELVAVVFMVVLVWESLAGVNVDANELKVQQLWNLFLTELTLNKRHLCEAISGTLLVGTSSCSCFKTNMLQVYSNNNSINNKSSSRNLYNIVLSIAYILQSTY